MMRPGLFASIKSARDALRQHHRRGQIGRHRAVPSRSRQALRASGRRDACVIDQDVAEPRVPLCVVGDQPVEMLVIRDIGFDSDRAHAIVAR